MTLGRALRASPLAASVAVLAHVVVFGAGHAPGAGHAVELLASLGIALVLALAGAFASGFAGRDSIATERSSGYAPLLLAAAGTGTFGLIEWGEGHFVLSAVLQAALTSLPIAWVVGAAFSSLARTARSAGHRCAELAIALRRGSADTAAFVLCAPETPVLAPAPVRRTGRGRAPPHLR